jgi:peptide/nickel transport system ATP-binding protein
VLVVNKIVRVRNFSVVFDTPRGKLAAVSNVGFDVNEGETLGIVGESGAGKSTLAAGILRLLPFNAKIASGEVVVDGKNVLAMTEPQLNKELRWTVVSYVPQASQNALDPLYKVRDQFVETVQAHSDMREKEILAKASELLEHVGVDPAKLDSYPWELSGGQKQRVMIALALILNPKIIIMDEPTTALDTIIQAQILELFKQLKQFQRLTSVFISHDIAVISNVADRIAVMYAGRLAELGGVREVFSKPLHPYTQGLLKSVPDMRRNEVFGFIPGLPPDLVNPPSGCPFHPRCPFVIEICKTVLPTFEAYGGEHYAACHVASQKFVEVK